MFPKGSCLCLIKDSRTFVFIRCQVLLYSIRQGFSMSVDSWGRTPTKPQSTKPNYPLHESHVSLKVRCLRLLFICFFFFFLRLLFDCSCILVFFCFPCRWVLVITTTFSQNRLGTHGRLIEIIYNSQDKTKFKHKILLYRRYTAFQSYS